MYMCVKVCCTSSSLFLFCNVPWMWKYWGRMKGGTTSCIIATISQAHLHLALYVWLEERDDIKTPALRAGIKNHTHKNIFVPYRHPTNATMYRENFCVKCRKTSVILPRKATPFAERGRVWSHCNYQVVVEEQNYQTQRLGNKMLRSSKHVT